MKGEFEKKLERFQKDAKTVLGIKIQFLPEEVYLAWIADARKEFPWRRDHNETWPQLSVTRTEWFLKWFGS